MINEEPLVGRGICPHMASQFISFHYHEVQPHGDSHHHMRKQRLGDAYDAPLCLAANIAE
jgi:hypothetical protein